MDRDRSGAVPRPVHPEKIVKLLPEVGVPTKITAARMGWGWRRRIPSERLGRRAAISAWSSLKEVGRLGRGWLMAPGQRACPTSMKWGGLY